MKSYKKSFVQFNMGNDRRKESVAEIFYAALKAVDPHSLVASHMDTFSSEFQKDEYNKFLVIGFGKAACRMAKAVEDSVNDFIHGGIAITKFGHCPLSHKPQKIQVIEAGHPVPDENGLKGAEKTIRLLKESDEKSLVLCLISGGGSALLISPFKGITLDDKKKITELLLKAGANIYDLNTVRKHISRVKGGRLAELAYPSRLISLVISDVIGDRLDVIASGPTAPDPTTYKDAWKILKQYDLIGSLPSSVNEVLAEGAKGLIPETPKEMNPIFEKVDNIIIGNNKKALEAAKTKADKLGFHSEVLSFAISGEAREVGKQFAKKANEVMISKTTNRPICLISGGETTVTVRGNGIGGRNMELALSFAMEIEDIDGITLLSAGTDGTDGPTDAAGAIVDGATMTRAKARGLNPENYLENNDSYTFFKETGDLFITGPTGTNVMDIQIVLIE
jgi:glycerate-2-kinase